ncbi:MAG: hypothetical protein CMG00_03340 [Candidatus Marinimicrobia bacterium]|nr:hypothetical protein [Candidatus Neomarinimicrobiota bacterium]|tara:strand:+ start:686 stop:3184 length:2499 start_codon:yes stop_codon:yes gene_type:complete
MNLKIENMIKRLKKTFSFKNLVSLSIIALTSVILIFLLHFVGVFSFLELKMYDFKFQVRKSIYENKREDLNVAIVYGDDQTYELLSRKFSYPYPRGKVYAKAIKNIASLGARVIVLDYVFDAPDLSTIRSIGVRDELLEGKYSSIEDKEKLEKEFPIKDQDKELASAIIDVKKTYNTDVILSGRISFDPNSTQGYFILEPSNTISLPEKNFISPDFGMVDIALDKDGFLRRYPIYQKIRGTDKYNYSLAVESVLSYYGEESNSVMPIYDNLTRKTRVGNNIDINTYGSKAGFLLNYYGVSSKALGSSGTFANLPLSQVIDDEETCLGECLWDEDEELYVPDYELNEVDDDWVNIMKWTGNQVFEDKIVVIGTSLAEDQDFKSVPLMNTDAGHFLMPGVDIHANAIQQLLHNSYISSSYNELDINSHNWFKHLGLVIAIVFSTLLIVSNFKTFGSTFSMLLLLFLWFNYSVAEFTGDFLWFLNYVFNDEKNIKTILSISNIVPTVLPMVSILIPYSLNLSYKLYTEGQNKKFLKDTFGTFVSPKLVDQMYESKQTPQLGGVDVYNTCFFSDIASFSSFSEKMTPPQLVELLNEYLEEMTNILLDNGGTLDKYIGDAIIAIFGSPISMKDHEYRGALSICQMNDKLEELRNKWKNEGDKWPEVVHNMRHRIGLNTGQIVAGNMGSSVRMSYTMMGDAVNTTARLESGAKQYGIESQVGEKIYEATKDKFLYRHLDHVRVKGKKNPVKTFELISEIGKEPSNYNELIPLWDKAVSLYKKQKWDDAIKLFQKCDKLEEQYIGRPTTPSLFFIDRCNEFKENPPSEDWDGIYTLKSK